MSLKTAQAAGGKAKAAKIHATYLAAPKICEQCQTPILPTERRKLAYLRRQRFCSQKCNARYRADHGFRLPTKPRKFKPCARCSGDIGHSNVRKFCAACWRLTREDASQILAARTRGKGPSAMRKLHLHAKTVVRDRPRICVRCGYDKHAEAAHIKPVASFSEDTLLSVVNAIENLVMLCPNCHWEFDQKLFVAADLLPK